MMNINNLLYLKNRKEWRKWLKENHSIEKEVWLIYFKKHTDKIRIPYEDAVEEALCFGWIDSIVKRIDDEKYCQRFTPRKENSGWSESNKKRVRKLVEEKRMTKIGLEKINAAKQNGMWYKTISSQKKYKMPFEFINKLEKNTRAFKFYYSLSTSQQKQFVIWIASAKKTETRSKRSEKAILLLKKKEKLGMV